MTPASPKSTRWATSLALGGALLPLAFGTYVPSVDLPGHSAIASVIVQLAGTGGPATDFYQLRFSESPYYLGYLYLSGAIAALGLEWGIRAVVALYAVATTLGLAALFRQLGAPSWAVLCSPLIVYSRVFVFGFVATFVGIPWVLWGLWSLLRWDEDRRGRFLAVAAVCGLLATLSHVFLLVVWAGFVLAFVLGRGRQGVVPAVGVVGFASLPLVPTLWEWLLGSGAGKTFLPFFGASWAQVVDYVVDVGGGVEVVLHAGLVGVAGTSVGVLVWRLKSRILVSERRADRYARMGIAALLIQGAIFVVAPLTLRIGNATATNVNWRFLVFVEVALYLVAWSGLSAGRFRNAVGIVQATTSTVFVVVFAIFTVRFNEAMIELDTVLSQVERGRILSVAKVPYDFGIPGYAPPVLDHAPEYYLARGGGFVTGIWPDAHVPIGARRRFLGQHRVRSDGRGGVEPLWIGQADYMLIVDGSSTEPIPPPGDGVRVASTSRWSLYRNVRH